MDFLIFHLRAVQDGNNPVCFLFARGAFFLLMLLTQDPNLIFPDFPYHVDQNLR